MTEKKEIQAADMPGQGVQTEEQTQNAIVQAGNTAVEARKDGGAYVTGLLQAMAEDFKAVNDGLDMDFVRMGTWLVVNKKGVFLEKDDESVKYGDTIDVVIGQGEKRWSLWGEKDSPEDGQLLTACKERADAEAELQAFLAEHPDAASRYSINDIELRYMAFVVPVATLGKEEFPKVYLMSFPPTTTISWGHYAMKIFNGGFKAVGIPARTGANKVVTRLTTVEKKSATDATISWLALEFEAVGMFNPADYGITE